MNIMQYFFKLWYNRCMFKIFKNSLQITKDNLVLIQPLIIFLLIISFALYPLKALQNNTTAFILVLINFSLLCFAFCAGWFGMIKKAVLNFKYKQMGVEYESENEMTLLKSFFPAVGQYFLPVCGFCFLLIILSFIFSQFIFKFGMYLFLDANILIEFLNQSSKSPQEQVNFLNTLSATQQILLIKWLLYLIFSNFIFNLFIFFSAPILFFKSKNPFVVLWHSILCVFKKPINTIGLYFHLILCVFIFLGFSILGNINLILSLITLFLTLIFMTYCIILVFLGYEELFNSNNWSNS